MGTSAELVGNVSFVWEVRMKNMLQSLILQVVQIYTLLYKMLEGSVKLIVGTKYDWQLVGHRL